MQTEAIVRVRGMRESDLAQANRIMRVAFGTFLGEPDPETSMDDTDFVGCRWKSDPSGAFIAEIDGEIAGSNFATHWGSFGFFGPLTVRPDLWGRGIGKKLMEPVLERFDAWNVTHAGLYTFAHSKKHAGLYQHFDFWPQYLTALMNKTVESKRGRVLPSLFSQLPQDRRETVLAACREVTETLLEGLDLRGEICAVSELKFGDTLLLWDDSRLVGFAVCHAGAGTEAGSGTCYMKFGAVKPGVDADLNFRHLLDDCEAYASSTGAGSLFAGVNTARHEAYRIMLASGFRTVMQGVAMQRGNRAGYNRGGVYAIDDWR